MPGSAEHGAAVPQHDKLGLGHILKVVHGECAPPHGHGQPTCGCQLIDVHLGPHAPLGCRVEYALRVLGSEEALVAKHVDEVGQPLAPHLGHHLTHHEVHVFVLAVAATNGMGTEEGGHHARRHVLAYPPYHAEHLQFVGRVQAVAALYLYTARTLEHHLAHTAHGLAVQFVLTECVEQVGRIEYPAATACYLCIAEPAYLVHKLALAAARIDYVRVGVAPRREHRPSTGVDTDIGRDAA